MMMTGYMPMFPLAATPLIVLAACAVYEAFLALARFRLSWLPPVGSGLALALCLWRLDNSSGLESLYWTLVCVFGGCAFCGTLLGLPAGVVLRCFRGRSEVQASWAG